MAGKRDQHDPAPTRRRRPTMRDIATEAGVSKGLVSMILSGTPGPSAGTTTRVLAIADRLGYRADRAASLLARRRSHMLGVTVEPRSPFHGELVEEIQQVADHRGYDIVLGPVTPVHGERRAIEALLGFRCEALLLLGSSLAPDELGTIAADVIIVSVGRPVELPGVDVVRTADRRGIGMAVDHLAHLGHRNIAHVDGGPGFTSAERRTGYQTAMRRHRLRSLVLPGGHAELDGARAAERLPPETGVTAIVAYNDKCALGIMDYLDRTGIPVPDEVSVTGFDDSFPAQLHRIGLTTVGQGLKEQARLAVTAAIERLDEGRTRRQEHILQPELVIRGSTGPAPTAR
jgi:DNA-binding LacI/PurR family transcriptional regulator